MLKNVNALQYQFYFTSDPHPFISEAFINLNESKADKILRLVQDTEKVQVGLVAGIRDNIMLSPFSAPFGGFHFRHENTYTHAIESYLEDLIAYAQNENLAKIQITLPPDIYCQTFCAKMVNALLRCQFTMKLPEISNWVELQSFNEVFTHGASRTYYKQAVKNKLEFHKVTEISEMESVYNLVVENRARMGRPIYMTFQDLRKTAEIFPTDYFKVVNSDGQLEAGAILYCAHPGVAYVIFWGDALEGRAVRAMDFLSFHLWSHYKAKGMKYIDVGISTESGMPNEGLLRFKETHECKSSLRFSFTWQNQNII